MVVPKIAAAVGLCLCGHLLAQGQDDIDSQVIEVIAAKARLSMPYGRAYDVLSRVRQASEGKIEVYFQAIRQGEPTTSANLVEQPTIWLEVDEQRRYLPVDGGGRFSIPLLGPEQAVSAELFTNAAKGSLSVRLLLRPAMRPSDFSFVQAKKVLELARRVRVELLPWYARLFVPSIHGLGVCYQSLARAVAVQHAQAAGERLPLVTEVNDVGQVMQCLGIDETSPVSDSIDTTGGVELLFIQSRLR